jgi:hypothetical protein
MKFRREPMFKDCRNLTEEELNEIALGVEGTLKKLEGKEYVKKPIKVKAVKIKVGETMPNWFISGIMNGVIEKTDNELEFLINTFEGVMGVMTVKEGDYVIQESKEKIYSCKAEVFEKYYEEVTNENNSKI